MVSRRLWIAGVLCVSLSTAGCAGLYRIDSAELSRLSYFKAGDEATLMDLEGREILFTSGTPLILVMRDGRVLEETFRSILSRGDIFHGTTTEDKEVEVATSEVAEIYVLTNTVKSPSRDDGEEEKNWLKSPPMIIFGSILLLATLIGLVVLLGEWSASQVSLD